MKRGGILHCHRMAEGRRVSAFLSSLDLRREQALRISNTPGIRHTARQAAKHEADQLADDITYLRAQYQSKAAVGEVDAQ
ncbi:hypothetical protein [Arenimonas oryziterrae]|uniref:Uncharacterized protein n=1 Tax=Arenimonas oryziterrae DSM 21050 = YC6267 TaxID=1121015 RepID=A0A091BCJ8_9GAMM|nr:hypothetical protein [Arenimonas oryziterrae]KFN42145.1 hypothetical protein N789_14680 [Arenimonas oryziterrae DSM 21050 = YC6267]